MINIARGQKEGEPMSNLIERQAAIDALGERPMVYMDSNYEIAQRNQYDKDRLAIETVPSVQPEPLSDAYTKAVWTWLLDYQIKASELKGRYTPYEVLSWVANDWRKEHER